MAESTSGRKRTGKRQTRWTAARAVNLSVLLLLGTTVACTAPRQPANAHVLERGVASWYGQPFHGRRTASGERYDMHELTAAHKTLPFGTVVEVHNLDNGRSVRVRINDRGPFVRGRIIDLSRAAARELDMVGPGTARVELLLVREAGHRQAAAPAPEDSTSPQTGGLWTVQVGAFEEPDRARDLRALLARHYPEARVRTDGAWHKVQVGEFGKRRRAERLQEELSRLGWKAVVVSADR